MNLSEHFTLDELLRNSGEKQVPPHILINARRTAQVLEEVRRQLGDVPIIPTSWYRPPAKNADTLGAARNSAHLSGYGVDFNIPGMTTAQVVAILAPHVRKIGIDQLIDERNHVHLSADPKARGQVLVEVREGEYLPWTGASAPGQPGVPVVKATPENTHKPGTLLWWLALLAAIIPVLLNFLGKAQGSQ